MLFFFLISCTISVEESNYPPILLTVNVHGHTYGVKWRDHSGEELDAVQQEHYHEHREELIWLQELAEEVGARLSIQLNGEYARDAILLNDEQHLLDLVENGHTLSAHFHRNIMDSSQEYWIGYDSDFSEDETLVRQTWQDHLSWIEEITGTFPLRVDASTGTDSQEAIQLHDTLGKEYGVLINNNWGERLSYTPWNIKPFNPFRRAEGTWMQEDPQGQAVSLHSLGQISQDPPKGKHAIYSSPTQIKRHLLMLMAEWREQNRLQMPEKIWQFGVTTHLDQNHERRFEVDAMMRMLANFTQRRQPGSSTPIATWATDEDVLENVQQWEANFPNTSAFSFDWSAYLSGETVALPYHLQGVLCGLKDTDFIKELLHWEASGVQAWKFRARDITRGELGENGRPEELTVRGPLEPIYMLWSNTGGTIQINFRAELSGNVYVLNGHNGAISKMSANKIKVTEQPIVIVKNITDIPGCQAP